MEQSTEDFDITEAGNGDTLESIICSNSYTTAVVPKAKEMLDSGKVKIKGDEITLALKQNIYDLAPLLQILVHHGCKISLENIIFVLDHHKFYILKQLLQLSEENVRKDVLRFKPQILIHFLEGTRPRSLAAKVIVDVCRILIEDFKVSVNFVNIALAYTALQEALFHDDRVFDYLLSVPGIDVNLTTAQNQKSPLQLAFDKGYFKNAAKLLLKFANYRSISFESMEDGKGVTKAFALLHTLGHDFDFEKLNDSFLRLELFWKNCCKTVAKRDWDIFTSEWMVGERSRMKSLKELTAVAVRKQVQSEEELDEIMNTFEWDNEVKGLLQLKHIDPQVPDMDSTFLNDSELADYYSSFGEDD